MAFMGETADIGLAELLSVLARHRHTGRLAVTLDGDEMQLYLERGQVILVSSTDHALRLGRLLIRLGIVQQDHLDQVLREQDRHGKGKPLGELLLAHGRVTKEQLARAASEQAIEALTRVIIAEHGTFMFSRGTKPTTRQGLVSLNADSIVLEASRRADEMMTLRTILPPRDAPLTLTPRSEWPAGETVNATEARVISALSEFPASLDELADRLPVLTVALWRAVVALGERGVLVSLDESGAPIERHVEPLTRSGEELIELCTGQDQPQPAPIPSLLEVRAGVGASSQTVAQLVAVVREVIAAFNAGLILRAFAHFTDDHFRRQTGITREEIVQLSAPGKPLEPNEQETFVDIRDPRILYDGRVSAILVTSTGDVGEAQKLLIFSRPSDRWQIDAVIEPPPTGIETIQQLPAERQSTGILSLQPA